MSGLARLTCVDFKNTKRSIPTPGPFDAIRFIHNALRAELSTIEAAASSLDASNAEQLSALSSQFTEFEKFVKMHEAGEENVIFPAIAAKAPNLVPAYDLDHRSNDRLIDEIQAALKAKDAKQAYRQAVALNSTMSLHLDKEEQDLYAVGGVLLSPPEQGALIGQTNAQIPKENMPWGVGYMFSRMDTASRVGMLKAMQPGMPPEALKGVGGIVAGAIGADAWAEVVQQMPELA